MSGTLYIVGTPIGNLKDITFRGVETLSSVDAIACEDTRHTMVLLGHYGISKPLISYYKQTEKAGTEKIIEMLRSGKNVALVTDAGMPCVSDPGAILVKGCREADIEVQSVPGPSAVVTAMSISGITDGKFAFIGFLPDRNAERRALLKEISAYKLPLVFYCAPHDLAKTISELHAALGDRELTVVKELTKMHESLYKGRLSSIDIADERGEFVLIVEPDNSERVEIDPSEELRVLLADGVSVGEAARIVALERGLSKNKVYSLALKLKNSLEES